MHLTRTAITPCCPDSWFWYQEFVNLPFLGAVGGTVEWTRRGCFRALSPLVTQLLHIVLLLNITADTVNLCIPTHVSLSQNNNLHWMELTKWEKVLEKLTKLLALNWEPFSNDFKCPSKTSYAHCTMLSWAHSSDRNGCSSWSVDMVAWAVGHICAGLSHLYLRCFRPSNANNKLLLRFLSTLKFYHPAIAGLAQ